MFRKKDLSAAMFLAWLTHVDIYYCCAVGIVVTLWDRAQQVSQEIMGLTR